MDTFNPEVTGTIMEWTNETSGDEQDKLQKSTAVIAIEGFTLLIITLVATAANITAITIILRVRSLRQNPHNLLILNLSVADLGVALTSMTFSLVSVFDGGYLLLTYHKVCLGHAFFAMIFSYVNFPTIVCIAVDRVLIVTNKSPLSHARAYAMIACCWIIALTNVMFPTNNWFMAAYEYLPDTLHCSPVWPNRIFRIIYAIINYGVVIIILTTCYIIITYHLRKKGKQLRCHQSSVPTRTLNTSMSSYQSPMSTAVKGTAQMATISSSGIKDPSPATKSSDSHEPKASSTDEQLTSLDHRPESFMMPSEISNSTMQPESESPVVTAQSSSVKASKASSTGEPLTTEDQSLESSELSSAIPKVSEIQLAPELATASESPSQLSPAKTHGKEHSLDDPLQISDNESLDQLHFKKEEEEEMQKDDKQPHSKPASWLRAVYAAKSTKNRSTNMIKEQGDKKHSKKEFHSVTETRTSQGYDSEKEEKGDVKSNARADKKKFKAEKRVAIMGALLVLTTMLCWTPYVLHHSKYLGLPEGHWFGVFTMWVGYCNALLDPLIYSFMNFRVRREIKRFFRSAVGVCNHIKPCPR